MLHPGMIGPENLAFTALGGLAIAAGDSSRNRRAYLAEVERRAERSELERELRRAAPGRAGAAAHRPRPARQRRPPPGADQRAVRRRGPGGRRDAAAAREALLHVKSASRKALEELRDTVEPAAPAR